MARAVDGAHGRMLWNVQTGEVATGGVDAFDFTEDGLIREVRSVGGTRAPRLRPGETHIHAAISLIPEAIAARRVIRLDYTSEDGQTRTTRDVEAMGLLRKVIRG